jgi:hypothetical protein
MAAINNPSIPVLNKQVEPTLKDAFDLSKRNIFLTMNCHAIGIIQSFNAAKQTASVSIAYVKTQQVLQSDGTYQAVAVNYPTLVDAPVICLGGGDWSLTFPIQAGDECVILFNDRDIDNWYQSGQVGPVASSRMHSFSDPLILVGPRSSQNVIESYDTTRAVLANGSTMVGVGSSLVKIANATTTLNTLLQNLITAIKNISTTNAVVGSPCLISTTSQTALANIATQIGQLLE